MCEASSLFARELVRLSKQPLAPQIAYEAKRSLFNVLGLAIGAAGHPGVDAILASARELGATQRVCVLGSCERTDTHFAALATGFAAHVDDFDDTHLATVIHPGAATLGVLVALTPSIQPTAAQALMAFALGCEAQLRVGVAISPEHYDRGWHITGTCGVIGSAVAASMLLGYDEHRLARAIRLSTEMTLGQREAFGTMAKAFHPGKASANGIAAALLARSAIDAPAQIFEAAGGFGAALSSRFDAKQMTDDMGKRWELAANTYKPYPCGIVAHPAIDAALALRARIDKAQEIDTILVDCHPLVPELMGNANPMDGLEARFSAIHGIAAALCDGEVGLAQYETKRVRESDVTRLRIKTTLLPNDTVARDEVHMQIALRDGSRLVHHVGHSRGSLARPLTDEELLEKFVRLVDPRLGHGSAQAIAAAFRAQDNDQPFGALLQRCSIETSVSHA